MPTKVVLWHIYRFSTGI